MELPYQSPLAPGRSWYEDSVERPRYPAMDGSRKVDVAVVGGGFTGLSAALHLARAGASVAVLEAHRFGDGASGRNGGQMGTGQRLWPMELEAEYGPEQAMALFRLGEEAKAHLLDLVAANDLDVDLARGQLSVVHKLRYLDEYRRQADELATRYDYPHVAFMDRAETAWRLGSERYHGGMRDAGTFHLNPMKLVVGLARLAQESGAALFEETPVTRTQPVATGYTVETERGTVTADRLLLATNAYGHDLDPVLDAHVMPIGSFIGATEPLAEPESILPGGESCDDSRFVVRYFRKSRDGRLLFGGREAYTSATGDIGRHIRAQIAEVYPRLKDVPLTHAWGGNVAITMKRMPFVRTLAPGATAIGGYSGHGVTLANFAGRLFAERIAGNRDRLGLLEELDIPPFPGGKRLRTPLMILAMTWFSLRDRL